MDERQQAMSEVEAHRLELQRVETELRAVLAEQAELEPSGLLARFLSSPDPGRLEELAMSRAVLEEELRIRRRTLHEAHQAMEQLDVKKARAGIALADVDDASTAARVLKALGRLDRFLGQLHDIASTAERVRSAPRPRRGSRRFGPSESTRLTSAVLAHTDPWEELANHAEFEADQAGVPLALPRRWEADVRPPGARDPAPDVALARKAALAEGNQDFGQAVASIAGELDRIRRRVWDQAATLEERFPEARNLRTETVAAPVATAPAQEPWSQLVEGWEALRKTFDVLAGLAGRGARTVDYLDAMGRWQQQAKAVGELPLAVELQLCPPVNDGGDLRGFVAQLVEAWPELDARFQAARPG